MEHKIITMHNHGRAIRYRNGGFSLSANDYVDESSAIIHSDTLFSALLTESTKLYGHEYTESIIEGFKNGEIKLSSVFHYLYNEEGIRVFFIPKPLETNLSEPIINPNADPKAIKAVQFISLGVYESLEPNYSLTRNAVNFVQSSYLTSLAELEKLFGTINKQNISDTGVAVRKSKEYLKRLLREQFIISSESKIQNNLMTEDEASKVFSVAYVETSESLPCNVKIGMYFLVGVNDKWSNDPSFNDLIGMLGTLGIGGDVSTGKGNFAHVEVASCSNCAEWKDYSFNELNPKVMNLGLWLPKDQDALNSTDFYQTKIRGGQKIFSSVADRRAAVRMITEGATFSKIAEGTIAELGKENEIDILRYGNPLMLAISLNYSTNEQ